jgi:hypothetical protein
MASLTADDNSHTIPQDPLKVVEDLKSAGNELFVAGKYKKAQEKYTEAIELGSEDPKLYGNRSATNYQLEFYKDALADAMMALELDPQWAKGYHRKAMALTALLNLEGAVACYELACKIEPNNGGYKKMLARARQRVSEAAKYTKIRGLKHWLSVYGSQSDVRLRLGVLAYFWNASTKPERRAIFFKFLGIIGGASAVDTKVKVGGEEKSQLDILKAKFTDPEIMSDLPLDNYSDLEVPEQWIKHFTDLKQEEKVIYFEQMYVSLNETEKTLVINDLKYFYSYEGPVQ